MLVVNPSVHLDWKVETQALSINRLVEQLRASFRQAQKETLPLLLEQAQEAHLERVLAGEADLVCRGCGLDHRGGGDLLRRGWRGRRIVTEEGPVSFSLRQVTCRGCKRTWSPYVELLGLRPGQRVLQEVEEKLVGLVTQLSYARTSELAEKWLGLSIRPRTLHRWVQGRAEQLQLRADAQSEVLLGDGTKIPSGRRSRLGEDVRIGFQLLGREEEGGRIRAQLRVVGVGIGLGSWVEALPAELKPALVVTDAEPALCALVRARYAEARHQLCEWHVGYTLDWSLIEDRVPAKKRKWLRRLLSRILFRKTTQARKRRRYERFTRWIGKISRTAQKQLQQASAFILYEEASVERTTSLVERQMREVNRRMELGVRWSDRGALNLLRLRLAQQHNPDDYARLWSRN
jgi:hypothetical protein